MAEIVQDACVMLGGVNLSGACNEVKMGHGADQKERTNFASGGWKQFLAGLQMAEGLEITGYRPSGEQPGAHIFDNASFPFVVSLDGVPLSATNPPAANDVARFCFARRASHLPAGDLRVGELNALRVTLRGTGRLYNGRVLAYSEAAATGNSGEVLLGAVAAGQTLAAALFVFIVTGSPTLDMTVQRDTTGFGSPSTALTFAQASAIGGQFLESTTAEATETFYRGNWTVGGTGTIGFLLVAGIE